MERKNYYCNKCKDHGWLTAFAGGMAISALISGIMIYIMLVEYGICK